jgi:hypothetical protein
VHRLVVQSTAADGSGIEQLIEMAAETLVGRV